MMFLRGMGTDVICEWKAWTINRYIALYLLNGGTCVVRVLGCSRAEVVFDCPHRFLPGLRVCRQRACVVPRGFWQACWSCPGCQVVRVSDSSSKSPMEFDMSPRLAGWLRYLVSSPCGLHCTVVRHHGSSEHQQSKRKRASLAVTSSCSSLCACAPRQADQLMPLRLTLSQWDMCTCDYCSPDHIDLGRQGRQGRQV